MTSMLCCTLEQDDRSGSPELPNARISEATPARQPLLPQTARSENSQFTSARSEELHELRQIFDNATDHDAHEASPARPPRSRFNRPSIYSLHSLHKMKSMHSILRQKFSRDLSKKPSGLQLGTAKLKKKQSKSVDLDTVIQQPRAGPNRQLGITKDDLRRNLLTDKKANEGGYDSDAEVLDDIARNLAKKSPGKRPSIHSIDWTSSPGSKLAPGSSSQGRENSNHNSSVQPYKILKPQATSLSARFSNVFSTPNLRADTVNPKDRKIRRSYSAASLNLPSFSPISPLRLPSLTCHDKDDIPWGIAMNESLRLSQFPVPPRHMSPKPPGDSVEVNERSLAGTDHARITGNPETVAPESLKVEKPCSNVVEIRVQEPTATTTPRPSTSIRGNCGDNLNSPLNSPNNQMGRVHQDGEAENNSRHSVHLYSMRISHHLRSGSVLSWDQLAESPEVPTPPRRTRERTVSDYSQYSQAQRQAARHERQSSSSGFASSKVPSKWGRVLPQDRDHPVDIASSIYSSRPHSPPDSFTSSAANISHPAIGNDMLKNALGDLPNLRRSASYPTDNDSTPRPLQRHSSTAHSTTVESSEKSSPLDTTLVGPKRSTSYSKRSKFREEFSPPPPRKRITPSISIMRLFNPKKASMRSQSEANLKPGSSKSLVSSQPSAASKSADRSHRTSRSLMSLETEQQALEKSKGSNSVWEQALRAHQEEKQSLFLPNNKQLAAHSNPFRERRRSGSISRSRRDSPVAAEGDYSAPKQACGPLLAAAELSDNDLEPFPPVETRRSALITADDLGLEKELQTVYEKQKDSAEIVGAWGRYPSHTRPERTFSADRQDHVDTRDFALQAAVEITNGNLMHADEAQLDSTTRIPFPPVLPGQKKRKKRIGSSRIVKSNSMTFGKTFLKNYARIFKSPSTEFQRHGHGHRSSIAPGGVLEYPELEILPDLWTPIRTEREVRRKSDTLGRGSNCGDSKPKGALKMEDSLSTLRPRRNSSAPNLRDLSSTHLGIANGDHGNDSARVWSVYYETCVPSFPRLSVDADLGLEDFGAPARHSTESKRASMHSRTMPTNATRHSRHGSRMSRISVISRASVRPSFVSSRDGDGGTDERSMVSVRRSTMDLVALYKQQEDTEHKRVLGLVRGESQWERDSLAGL